MIFNMKYGISIQKNLVKVHKRIIISGLSPTQVASEVQFGMSRPEWVKFIVSAGAHHQLDLSDSADRYELVHNEEWGLLVQAFTWKREAYEANESSAGYGIGFNQLESSRETSYGVLQQNFSTSRLCEEIFNDIMSKLRTKDLEECTRLFSRIFSRPPKKPVIRERLAKLAETPVGKRKRGLIQLYVSAINDTLNFMLGYKTPDLLTIPTYFFNIVRDLGVSKWPNDKKVLSVLYSDKPGEIPRGLSNVEIAVLIHELLKGENVRPIVLSYAVFDLSRGELPFDDDASMDRILRDSYDLLPEDSKITQYIKDLHKRITSLLQGHVPPSSLMSYNTFAGYLSIEKIKQQAVFWEYNLVLGQLEEMLRRFVESYAPPPYLIQFEKRWDALFDDNKEYWEDVVYRFQELCFRVLNTDCYISALKSRSGFRYDLQGWFEIVCQNHDLCMGVKDAFRNLLRKASEIGDSIKFDGNNIKVLYLPTPINPFITRGALYSWLRVFTNIWQ